MGTRKSERESESESERGQVGIDGDRREREGCQVKTETDRK